MLPNHPELAKVRAVISSAAPAAAAAPTAAAAPAAPSAAEVLFAVGSPTMSDEASKVLAPVIDALKADATAKVTLSGYHSASGDAAQNEELAKQRAFAVRDALKAAGIAEDRIVLDKPQTTEANVAGEDARARRVELAVMK